MDFDDPDFIKRRPDRAQCLSQDSEMGRRRSAGSDYRICQFRGGAGHRVSEGRAGHGDRLQDLYHRGTGDLIRGIHKLGAWAFVLDREDRGNSLIMEKAGTVDYDTGITEYCI